MEKCFLPRRDLRMGIVDAIKKGGLRVGYKAVDEHHFVFKGMEHLGVLKVTKAGSDMPLQFQWLDVETLEPVWIDKNVE